jgi:hypothetical protein
VGGIGGVGGVTGVGGVGGVGGIGGAGGLGRAGGFGGAGGQIGGLGNLGVAGFSTQGMIRAPSYVTVIDFKPPPPPAPTMIQTNLQGVLSASTLTAGKGLSVSVSNERIVVLQGTVGSERERRLAEAVIRLNPGVRDVQNDIIVVPGAEAR